MCHVPHIGKREEFAVSGAQGYACRNANLHHVDVRQRSRSANSHPSSDAVPESYRRGTSAQRAWTVAVVVSVPSLIGVGGAAAARASIIIASPIIGRG